MQINTFRMMSALLGLASRGALSCAADLKPFKIGISAPVVTIFPVWMAEAGGFYEKEGLKVEVVNMEGGTRGLQVLLSGEIQGMHVGLAPAVLANKQGADLRLVTSTCNTIPITMFTKAGVGMADLKGKTFGISTFGSETDIAISILLKRLGLTRQDVTVSQIGGSSQRFARAGRRPHRCRAADRAGRSRWRRSAASIRSSTSPPPRRRGFSIRSSSPRLSQAEPRHADALRESLCCGRLPRARRREEGERADRAEVQDQRPEGDCRHLRRFQAPDAARRCAVDRGREQRDRAAAGDRHRHRQPQRRTTISTSASSRS